MIVLKRRGDAITVSSDKVTAHCIIKPTGISFQANGPVDIDIWYVLLNNVLWNVKKMIREDLEELIVEL